MVLGTPTAMAPEQVAAQREAIGPWTDVWGLGVVLYEISTGRRLADWPSTPPEWLQPGHTVEWEFHEIVLRLAARDPSRRHRDARDLRDELMLLRGGRSVRQLRARERRNRLLTRLAILVSVMGLLGWAVTAVWPIFRQS